jgi:hypothetical protein
MSYGFRFETGPAGSTLTSVVSDDLATGFLVPATTTTTLTVTSITNGIEGGEFICSEMVLNAFGPVNGFQPGLQSGHLRPNIGTVVSGPGLPDNTKIIGTSAIATTSLADGERYLLDKPISGSASTAPDAYTLTTAKTNFPIIAYPNDSVGYTTFNNQLQQRPFPDTIINFSDSPFTRHDVIVFPTSYFDGAQFGFDSSTLERAISRPIVSVDQTAKVAYANHMRGYVNSRPIPITVATSTTGTTVTLSNVAESDILQEMYMIGPGCGRFGIRVTPRTNANYRTSFNVASVPIGGWNYSANVYFIVIGFLRYGLYEQTTFTTYRMNPNANMWWRCAIIGRFI